MKILKVDHIGIAVSSIGEIKKLYTDILGLPHLGSETVVDQKVTTAFFPVGETGSRASRIDLPPTAQSQNSLRRRDRESSILLSAWII